MGFKPVNPRSLPKFAKTLYMETIIAQSLLNSHSYNAYRKTVSDLLAEGKATGGVQSEALVHYSLLNETRMNRLEKTVSISEEMTQKLQALPGNYIWLVLSEGWCGDAAQLLPVFHKMALASGKIELKMVFRDANPALMDLFLTNGARSIPKLIILEPSSNKVLGSFGPRPKAAADLIRNYKEKFGVIDDTVKTELQKWYLHDKGLSTQNELVALMESL